MKKQIIFICLFLSVLTLHARAIQEDIKNADENARTSYAFGMLIGSDLQSIPIKFDYNAFAEGFRAMAEGGETLLSYQEALEIAEAAFQAAMDSAGEEQRIIQEEFLSNNSVRPEVHVTPSGLQYEIIEGFDGEKPNENSVVKVKYRGTLIDGTMFDSSDDEGSHIPLQMVIPGWSEGLQLMSVGSKYRLYIPSTLAYGKNGVQGIIPQYATLIFTVELLEILEELANDQLE